MLFSEPKISQLTPTGRVGHLTRLFQCSSASRKFLNFFENLVGAYAAEFQCSSASRKFLNASLTPQARHARPVSVLFSEPKISQTTTCVARSIGRAVSVLFSEPKISQCDNICHMSYSRKVSVLFSEPKISQSTRAPNRAKRLVSFSALQRAENFSSGYWVADSVVATVSVLFSEPKISQLVGRETNKTPRRTFQCSSASRKFLNSWMDQLSASVHKFQCSSASRKFLNARRGSSFSPTPSFSALQRAENFSIVIAPLSALNPVFVSVLFSEPKISQRARLAVAV